MVVPNDIFHGSVRLPQIPELDEAVFTARHQAERLVGIVVQVSNRETMRLLYRSCCSVKAGVGQWLITIRAEQCRQNGRVQGIAVRNKHTVWTGSGQAAA